MLYSCSSSFSSCKVRLVFFVWVELHICLDVLLCLGEDSRVSKIRCQDVVPFQMHKIPTVDVSAKAELRIRMLRASALNGDGLYAIKSFNVYFDTNLAHFKPITAAWRLLLQRGLAHCCDT